MAKMANIELKSYRTFEGRDGMGFSGNIYYNKKKVGEVFDYADGSIEYDFHFISKEIEKEVSDVVRQYYEKHPCVDTSKIYNTSIDQIDMDNLPVKDTAKIEPWFLMTDFFYNLTDLKEKENVFKKMQKDGYGQLVCIDYYSVAGSPTPKPEMYQCSVSYNSANVLEMARLKSKTAHMTIYRTLEDFSIN